MSGANTVRGGSDSHTFPPVAPRRRLPRRSAVLVAALILVCVATPVFGQQDSLRVEATPFRPSPMGAFWRSAAVPGWGQLYNRRVVRAVLVSAGRVTLAARLIEKQRLANRLEDEARALELEGMISARDAKWRERNRALDRRDDFIWWSVFALTLSIIDAYVDAALMEFNDEFEGVDERPGESSSLKVGVGFTF